MKNIVLKVAVIIPVLAGIFFSCGEKAERDQIPFTCIVQYLVVLLRQNNLRQIVAEYGETFLHSLIFIRTKYNRICLVQNNVYLATVFTNPFNLMEQRLHAPRDRPENGLPKEISGAGIVL